MLDCLREALTLCSQHGSAQLGQRVIAASRVGALPALGSLRFLNESVVEQTLQVPIEWPGLELQTSL